MRWRLLGVGALSLAFALASVTGALAHWSAPGTGIGPAATATLAPAAISVPASATNTVTLTWSAQASLVPSSPANSQIAYSLQRRLDDDAYAAVSSGDCAGLMPFGTASCVDGPPGPGSYSYRVVARVGSWTATSADTSSVALSFDGAPLVEAITRLDADPSNAGTLRWSVTFTQAVSGVGAADFALSRGGTLTGGSVGTVTGSGASYTVSASTGTGSGALGLDLVDDDSIVAGPSNPLGGPGIGNGDFSGQSYTVDRTAPTLSSIVAADATPTNAATVSWTVTFSEAVGGVDAADFTLARTGSVSASAQVQSVSGSGSTRTVTATTVAGEGTLGLNFAADGTVVDDAGNPVAGDVTGQTYTIDRTAPASTQAQMLDTDADGKIDRVRVLFDETLASSTATAPWALTNVPSAGTLASVSVSGAVATLTLNEGADAADTAVGSFTVALTAHGAGIRDAAGNGSSFAAAAPIDHATPVRTAMSMLDVNTNGRIDKVTVSFSEALASPITATAFTLANTPSGGILNVATASTNVVALTITEGAAAASTAVGAFTVALAAAATGVRDSAGNQASFTATAPADKAAPVPVGISDTSGTIDGRIEPGDSFVATFSEAIAPASLPASTPITENGVTPDLDSLTINGFTSGALGLGSANYVAGTSIVVFAGTSALSGGGATITITVGACTSACGRERTGTGVTTIYAPATTLLDAAANAAAGTRSTGFRIF